MYQKQTIPIPQNAGRIVLVKSNSATYVYYQTDRIYDPDKKYNSAKRTSIGKVSESDNTLMHPNEKYFQYFSETPYQETEATYDSSDHPSHLRSMFHSRKSHVDGPDPVDTESTYL